MHILLERGLDIVCKLDNLFKLLWGRVILRLRGRPVSPRVAWPPRQEEFSTTLLYCSVSLSSRP